jgi:hypothetical protein
MSIATSSGGRLKFSMLNANTVTLCTRKRMHQSSICAINRDMPDPYLFEFMKSHDVSNVLVETMTARVPSIPVHDEGDMSGRGQMASENAKDKCVYARHEFSESPRYGPYERGDYGRQQGQSERGDGHRFEVAIEVRVGSQNAIDRSQR